MKQLVVREYFKYELISGGVTSALNSIISCNIQHDADSALKDSATFSLAQALYEDITIRDRLRVIHVRDGVEKPVGTFILASPDSMVNSSHKEISVVGYSTLWLILINKLTTRYLVPKGTQLVLEIRRIIESLSLTINITDSVASTNVDLEFPMGTPYLTMINELLRVINYTSLYTDAQGVYTSVPYVDPQDRKPDITFDGTKITDMIVPRILVRKDLFDVPNRFVRYVNNPDVNLVATYENNDIQNPTSLQNAPPNTSVEEVPDAADMQTLIDIGKRDCRLANDIFSEVELYTAIRVEHLHDACIQVSNLNGITMKTIEKRWSIECTSGGLMTHNLKEVVPI